jgi:hypothetical protein
MSAGDPSPTENREIRKQEMVSFLLDYNGILLILVIQLGQERIHNMERDNARIEMEKMLVKHNSEEREQ